MRCGYRARVDDRYTLAWIFALLTLGTLLLATLIVTGAIVLRFRGGRPGRRLGSAVVFLFGFMVGYLILFSDSQPIFRAVVLGLVGAGFLGLLWRDRRIQAGAFLAGTALPWTILWGWYLVRMASGGLDVEPTTTWAMFLAGAVPLGIGVTLVSTGDPLAHDPLPTAPAGQPGSRRIGTVAQIVYAPEAIGPISISELAAFVATIAGVAIIGFIGLPFPAEPVAQVAVGALTGSEARILVRPARSRRAFEAFAWLGEWEMARIKTETGRTVPGTRWGMERFLASVATTPENAWMRVELLLFLDRYAEARVAAESMPGGTPAERFERAYSIDMADWIGGGTGTPEPLKDALAGLAEEGEDTRLRAEVSMAIREARLIAAGQDRDAAIEPLLRVRDRLGKRADGQMHRGPWRRFLPASLITAVIVTLLGVPFA
jgi:hypothetical protein